MRKILTLINMLITIAIIIFEALPYGTVMSFYNPDPNVEWLYECSYFSIVPLGYGLIFPALICLFTIVLIPIYIVNMIREEPCVSMSSAIAAWNLFQLAVLIFFQGNHGITMPTIVIIILYIIMLVINYIIHKISISTLSGEII